MFGHTELEEIRKGEVIYRIKQKPDNLRDQGRVAGADRSHSLLRE
jgi:hypothetical protein